MVKRLTLQSFEIFRFGTVGSVGAATDFVVYFGLLHIFPSLPTSPTKAISYICGNVVSFFGHRRFVFYATHHHLIRQVGPFAMLYGSTLLLNNITNEVLISIFDNRFFAWFFATGMAVTTNYLGMKFIVFKRDV